MGGEGGEFQIQDRISEEIETVAMNAKAQKQDQGLIQEIRDMILPQGH